MTTRTIPALAGPLAAALLAALLVLPSAAVPVARDARTLPTLAGAARAAAPANAFVTQTDTFLVASHGFDELLPPGCDMRGWLAEDRTGTVYVHNSDRFLVNQAYFTGLQPAPDADNLTGRASTTRLSGGAALAVGDSGQVILADAGLAFRFFAAYPGSDVMRSYGTYPIGTGNPMAFAAFDPGGHRLIASDARGLYAFAGDGGAGVKIAGFGTIQADTLVAVAAVGPTGLAVDAAGNIYFSELETNRVRMLRTDGRVVTLAGTGAPGAGGDGGPGRLAQFFKPLGVALEASGQALLIADQGNHKIRRLDLVSGIIDTWYGDGSPDLLPFPSHLAISGSRVYVTSVRRVIAIEGGTATVMAGGGGPFGPADGAGSATQQYFVNPTGLAADGAGGVYFIDGGLRLAYHLDAAGGLSVVAGVPVPLVMGSRAMWFGADPVSHPAEVAHWVRESGYGDGWSQRLVSPTFSVTAHPAARISFDGWLDLGAANPISLTMQDNGFVTVQALSRFGTWVHLNARVTAETGQTGTGPVFVGRGRFHAEAYLGADDNELRPYAEPTRLRIVVQTPYGGSDEDGLYASTGGAAVVDNLSVRDSLADVLPPADFEDGGTGVWTLEAQNGTTVPSGMIAFYVRDKTPAATAVALRDGFDFLDPSCVWTFLSPNDSIGPRFAARLTSPWFALAPGDTSFLVSFSGKLPTINQARSVFFWARTKRAGDARPRLMSPSFFRFNSGTEGTDAASPLLRNAYLRFPQDFQLPLGGDSVQIVIEAGDTEEALDTFFLNDPSLAGVRGSRLPFLDDLRLYQRGVDQDFDGVADAGDACADSCAAGQDADGDGCLDATATMRHVESWRADALPLRYTISQAGDPRIGDGSDITAITNGFQAWTLVPGTSLQVVQNLPSAQTEGSAINAFDGVNLVTFQDSYVFSPNVVAVTPTLSATRRQSYNDQVVLPGRIVDSDMMLNPQISFRTPSYDPGPGSIDLESVVTHEAGHFYGLSHSGVIRSTMFFVLQNGTQARSLEADDRAAIAAAYPAPAFATDYATITGQVTRGLTGNPIPGALVTAVSLSGGGQPADSVASDYTDEMGVYRLRGLAPGSYSVRVTPLDGEMGGYPLTPDYISDRLDRVAETNFQAEWWCEPESDRDTDAQRGLLDLGAGETRAGVNVFTNVDTIAPVVVSVAPRADTTDVRIDTSILVTFSERIEPTSLQGNFRLHPEGTAGALGGDATLVQGGRSLIFTPGAALLFGMNYVLDITTGVTDREGVPLANPHTSGFRTQDPPPVTITAVLPQPAFRGMYVTLLGTGFDPAGTDSVRFHNLFNPLGPYEAAVNVTPTSMVVRVPVIATSGDIQVKVNGALSNLFFTSALPPPVPSAPSRLADVALSFSPTDVALSPAGDYAFAVGRDGLAAVETATGVVTSWNIGASQSLALTPEGHRAWVTQPQAGEVVEVDTDPSHGTFGHVLGHTPVSSGTPFAITMAPTGRFAYLTDRDAGRLYKVNTDATSVGYGSVVDEIPDTTATLAGLALSPAGDRLFYGTRTHGPRSVALPGRVPQELASTLCAGGVAVDPAAQVAAFAGAGLMGVGLLHLPVDSLGPAASLTFLGGEVRDVAFSADGRSAFVVNGGLNQLQMVDETPGSSSYRIKIAEVGTGSLPVALALDNSGTVIAVANSGSRSLSFYRTGGTAALIRAVPGVARPGDVVALQASGAPFGPGSQLDVGGGPFDPGHVTADRNGASFVVPAGEQRDASVAAVDSAGLRTLGIPLRVVDPILSPVPHETGFARMLDSLVGVVDYVPTHFTSLRLSPDGRLIAITRDKSGSGEWFDLVLAGENGVNRMGTVLASVQAAPDPDQVLGAAFTPDGKEFWISHTELITFIIDTDPASPNFGTPIGTLPFVPSANVGPLAADPLGRFMIEGDYVFTDSLHLYTLGRVPLGAIEVAGWIGAVAVSPDGRWVVSAGAGRVNFGDLDALTALPGSPLHGSPTTRGWSIVIPHDGKRAVVRYPDGSLGVYNLDPGGGAVGAELYYGNPLTPGTTSVALAPAPDGRRVLVSTGGPQLAVLDPQSVPPAVSYAPAQRPIGIMEASADGRRLWTEGGAGTTSDSLRLVSLSPATALDLVSGGGQSATPHTFLAEPLRFRATDANGNPEVGAMLRFDGVHGMLPILDNWDTPLWHLTDANGEVQVRWMVPSVPGTDTLVVQLLGSSATVVTSAEVVADPATVAPVVTSFGPVSGASGINAGTQVSVTFSKPMDSTSVVSHMSLHASGAAAAGTYHASADGKTFFFQPGSPLAYSARCSLAVAAGALDTYGLATAQADWSVFTVQAPPALVLTSLAPPSGPVGTSVVLAGDGFSPVPSQNTVLFNGVLASVTNVTATSLVATVPAAATTGAVTVQVGSTTSGGLDFNVLSSSPDLGGVIGSLPASQGVRDVAITSDGLRAYVTNPSTNSVTALDIQTVQQITNITVGLQPQGVAIVPGDSLAYVANTGSDNVSVICVDPTAPAYHTVVATIPVGDAPVDVAVSALGPRVIVVNSGSSDVSIIDANPGNGTFDQVTNTVACGSGGNAVAISPDGGRAFVVTANGDVVVIDLLTDAVTATVHCGSSGESVAISPDGTTLFVLLANGTISIINVAEGTAGEYQVVATVSVGAGGQSVAISPDGGLLEVTGAGGNVVAIYQITYGGGSGSSSILPGPTVTLTFVGLIDVGQSPAGIAIDPSQGLFALVCNAGTGTVSLIGLPDVLAPVSVEFDFNPNTLNLRSLGSWVQGWIEPQPPRTASEIVVSSIRLNGIVPVDTSGTLTLGDHDQDGLPDLGVKFLRTAVSLLLPEGDQVPVTVTGTVGPRLFTGTDTIQVRRARVRAPLAGAIVLPGQTFTVNWEVPDGLEAQWVALLHTFDGGVTWVLDDTRLPNTGSCAWNVPAIVADSAQVGIVLVESSDGADENVTGVLGVSGVFHVFGPTEAEPPPVVLSFAPIRPNPAGGRATLRFGLPRSTEASLEIFDLQGRRVRTLASGRQTAGWHGLEWTGRTDGGGHAEAGLYFVRFRAEGHEFRQRLVWLQ